MRTCVGSRGGRQDLLLTQDALRCDGGLLRDCDGSRAGTCGRLGISLSGCAETFSIVSILCRDLQADLGMCSACRNIDSEVSSCGGLLSSCGGGIVGQGHVSLTSAVLVNVGQQTVRGVTGRNRCLCGDMDSLILCTAKTTTYSATSLLIILRDVGASLSGVRGRLGGDCFRS